MAVLGFDHVGVVVRDLDEAVRFFEVLGFERGEPAEVAGDWADRILAIEDVRVDMVWVSTPDGSGSIELSTFRHPASPDGVPAPPNAVGYRHIAYRVSDVDAVVRDARAAGYDTVGEVVDYEDVYRVAHLRGPEGLIVEVAQPLQRA